MARIERLPPPPERPVRSPPMAVAGETETLVGGRIETRLHVPPAANRAVLICHPHPLYGGSMHSPVPLAIAKTLADRKSATVAWARFNYRGVGASTGTYDDGRGELDDARDVLAHLLSLAPNVPAALCGHSFGSWIALRAAGNEPRVDRVALIAPSNRFFTFEQDAFVFTGEKAVFLGDKDEYCDVAEGRALAERLGASFRVFEGYDHHFLKSRRAVAEATVDFVAPDGV